MAQGSSVPRKLTGTQKVAIMLMQMDQEHAAEVMRQFTEFEADEIAARTGAPAPGGFFPVEDTVREIHELATSGKPSARGGRDMAAGLLEASFGSEKANTVMNRLSSSMAGMTFEFLEGAEPAHIGCAA